MACLASYGWSGGHNMRQMWHKRGDNADDTCCSGTSHSHERALSAAAAAAVSRLFWIRVTEFYPLV